MYKCNRLSHICLPLQTHCRNWLKTGNCSYGNTCRYTHGTPSRGKGFSGTFSRWDSIEEMLFRKCTCSNSWLNAWHSACVLVCRSAERPPGDLRERMKNKRQDVDGDTQKRDADEPTSPTTRVGCSNSLHLLGQFAIVDWLFLVSYLTFCVSH